MTTSAMDTERVMPKASLTRRLGLGGRNRYTQIATYAGLWIALIWSVFPFYWMISTSLRSKSEIFQAPPAIFPQSFSLENYLELLLGVRFWLYAVNSVGLAAAVTILSLAFAVTSGYALARYRFHGSTALPLFMLYGQMFPPVLLLIPFYIQMRNLGMIDSLWGLIPINLSYQLPLAVWLMRGYFAQVPHSLEDAARMDGCTRWQAFWIIIMPMARPGIIAVATWVLIYTWNEYLYASTFIVSERNRTLPLGLAEIIGQYSTDWGLLTAGGVVTSVPILALFFAVQRYLVPGASDGAVKG